MNGPLKRVLQSIEVDPEWHENIKDNLKKITIREGLRDYVMGRVMLCCEPTSWCISKNISSIIHEKLSDVSDSTAREEGFIDCKSIKNKLSEYYPNISDDSWVTIIRWN